MTSSITRRRVVTRLLAALSAVAGVTFSAPVASAATTPQVMVTNVAAPACTGSIPIWNGSHEGLRACGQSYVDMTIKFGNPYINQHFYVVVGSDYKIYEAISQFGDGPWSWISPGIANPHGGGIHWVADGGYIRIYGTDGKYYCDDLKAVGAGIDDFWVDGGRNWYVCKQQ